MRSKYDPTKIILFTALDWGLGHAARTAEIIDRALEAGYEVVIAASGRGYFFYKKRYKNVQIEKIPALTLSYSRRDSLFELKILITFFKFLVNVLIDRLFTLKLLRKYRPNLIISDNRFGIYSRKVYSVIISHHINIQVPSNLKFLDKLLYGVNCFFFKKFNENWIPDYPGEENLAGRIDHFRLCNLNSYYIGLLSRFKNYRCQPKKEYDFVCLVSGIEPQRSIFVDKLLEVFRKTDWKVLIVSGIPESNFAQKTENITMVSHLQDTDFCSYVKGAKYLVIRAGYSTIMDLVALGRTALIVPTPNQTEQEYIAFLMHTKKLFYRVTQHNFSLENIKDFVSVSAKLQRNLDHFRLLHNLS